MRAAKQTGTAYGLWMARLKPRPVLRASRLFDGKSDTVVQPGIVVVSGNKIQSIGGE
jgi:hypothetical protein